VHPLVREADGHGTLADGRRHPLGRAAPHVSCGEKTGQAGSNSLPSRSVQGIALFTMRS